MRRTNLPPELADAVQVFRAELIAAREEQTRRLRATFDQLKHDAEIDIEVLRRLTEMFKDTVAS